MKDGIGTPCHLSIKVAATAHDGGELKRLVTARMTELFGDPLPEAVGERVDGELAEAVRFGYAPIYLTHGRIIREIEKRGYPFCLFSPNGASVISFALGVSRIDPLPPHRRCTVCGRTEFVRDEPGSPTLHIPCSGCGGKTVTDGSDLAIESFLGFRHDRCPYLALGVPASRFERTVSFMETEFGAAHTDAWSLPLSTESGSVFVLADVLPVDGLCEESVRLSPADMDDPKVFARLSDPNMCDCYIADRSVLPLVKELLGTVDIGNRSDLIKVCGLIAGSGLLPVVLPRLENGTAELSGIICTREDVYRNLAERGVDPGTSFRVMEATRKGRAARLFEDEKVLGLLLTHGVSEEYLDSLKNVGYLTTDAVGTELALAAYHNAQRRLYE